MDSHIFYYSLIFIFIQYSPFLHINEFTFEFISKLSLHLKNGIQNKFLDGETDKKETFK